MRTTTVGITGFPQPNPRCQPIQSLEVTFKEAVQFVFRGILPHACGDLVFSGHVSCVFTCMVIFHKHQLFGARGILPYFIAWMLAITSVFTVISCRSHYSVDAILAFYFVYFTQDWYYARCNCNILTNNYYSPFVVKYIAWLEDRLPCHDKAQDEVDYIKINLAHSTDSENDYNYYPYHCDLR